MRWKRGGKPVAVAEAFFDATSIEEAAPEIAGHNKSLILAHAKSEKSKANAAYQIITNIMFLMRVAHKSLSSGRFEQQAMLKSDFFVALMENQWPADYAAVLNEMLTLDISGLPNDDIDQMLGNAEDAFEEQLDATREFGDYEALKPHEYATLS